MLVALTAALLLQTSPLSGTGVCTMTNVAPYPCSWVYSVDSSAHVGFGTATPNGEAKIIVAGTLISSKEFAIQAIQVNDGEIYHRDLGTCQITLKAVVCRVNLDGKITVFSVTPD